MEIGIKGYNETTVTSEMLAKNVGSGTVSVYATPMMIALIEKTAEESVRNLIGDEKVTVGTLMNVSHIAATPEGMSIHAKTELIEIEGKILTFKVSAFDEKEKIGEGIHKRAVVTKNSFEQRAQNKLI